MYRCIYHVIYIQIYLLICVYIFPHQEAHGLCSGNSVVSGLIPIWRQNLANRIHWDLRVWNLFLLKGKRTDFVFSELTCSFAALLKVWAGDGVGRAWISMQRASVCTCMGPSVHRPPQVHLFSQRLSGIPWSGMSLPSHRVPPSLGLSFLCVQATLLLLLLVLSLIMLKLSRTQWGSCVWKLFQAAANQGREGMKRIGRSSQDKIVQPWGRVLDPSQPVHITVSLGFSLIELKPLTKGRC